MLRADVGAATLHIQRSAPQAKRGVQSHARAERHGDEQDKVPGGAGGLGGLKTQSRHTGAQAGGTWGKEGSWAVEGHLHHPMFLRMPCT